MIGKQFSAKHPALLRQLELEALAALAKMPTPEFTSGFGGGSTESRTIALPAGSEVVAKLAIPGYSTNSSRVWKP